MQGELDADDLVLVNRDDGKSLPPGRFDLAFEDEGKAAIFTYRTSTLGPLPSANYEAILLTEDTSIGHEISLQFWFLNGDANRDRKVDFSDFLVLRGNFGRTDNPLFSEADFNYDGKCDFADFLILRSKFGVNLPPPSSGSLFAGGEDDEASGGAAGSVLS